MNTATGSGQLALNSDLKAEGTFQINYNDGSEFNGSAFEVEVFGVSDSYNGGFTVVSGSAIDVNCHIGYNDIVCIDLSPVAGIDINPEVTLGIIYDIKNWYWAETVEAFILPDTIDIDKLLKDTAKKSYLKDYEDKDMTIQ